ncbi:MAG TPA: rod shape-determining protein MreC [Solirubrobacteraceae bacterium]|nr:rod shape-determining protein MreC [Solirubrobacteraceae bacterium]
MYDKTVRRRRAVLGLLVALSLILLTESFGDRTAGGLNSVQRGFLTILSPLEDGASRALKPVHDLFGWVGDTVHAKSQRDTYHKELQAAVARLIQAQAAARVGAAAMATLKIDETYNLDADGPVNATVNVRSDDVFNEVVGLDKGSSSGVAAGDPVVNGDGLVGKVADVTSNQSFVTLINDSTSGVSATDNTTGAAGLVVPTEGDPDNLTMSYLASTDIVKEGDVIVTAGTVNTAGGPAVSHFPPNIPIGRVTSVDHGDLVAGVHLAPMAKLHDIDDVQVLTRVPGA